MNPSRVWYRTYNASPIIPKNRFKPKGIKSYGRRQHKLQGQIGGKPVRMEKDRKASQTMVDHPLLLEP